jgi:hypothetical protein
VYDMGGTTWPDSVTWNSRPAINGPLLATIGPVILNQVVEVNVRAAVQGNGLYSFAITAPGTTTNTVGYASRESNLVDTGPLLVIVARTSIPSAGVSSAPGTPTPTPALLAAPPAIL